MNRSVSICVFACALLALSLTPAFAQPAPDPNPQPAPTVKEFAIIAGVAMHSTDGAPQFGGTFGGLYPVSPNNALGVIADVTKNPGVTVPGNRLKTNVRFEYARKTSVMVAGWPIYVLADIGGTFQASDPTAILQQAKTLLLQANTNAGYQMATGIASEKRLYRSLYIAPAVRLLKGSIDKTGIAGGVNFMFKGKIEQK